MKVPFCEINLVLLLAVAVPFRTTAQSFDATNAAQVIDKMQTDVVEMARQVERLYGNRCNESTLTACANSTYDPCRSQFPTLTCPAGAGYTSSDCGDGVNCSVLTDFTNSELLFAPGVGNGADGNPTDPLVIEGVCSTVPLDDWFRQKLETDKPFWAGYGIDFPPYYYSGQAGGYQRYFPGGVLANCDGYDPRVRPWYAAATSGPKNVVLLLDTSSSMGENGQLDLLKKAASTVVSRLSVGDRIAIVPFNDTASFLGSNGGYVYTPGDNTKNELLTLIDGLSVGGGANISEGFTKAFDVLEASVKARYAVSCHSAILLMSTGGAAQSSTTVKSFDINDLLQYIGNRSSELMGLTGGKVVLFTYSIAPQGGLDPLLKQIACSTEYGIWNTIASTENISDSLESYYMLFALALGSDANKNFAAWAEPYIYYTGEAGTTVSVPVYDRTKNPHVFLGVAAVDFLLTALDVALGEQGNTSASASRVAAAATAVCPSLELSPCVLESLRRDAVGKQGICGTYNCSVFVQVREETCPNVTEYPSNIWNNLEIENMSFVAKGCCKAGGNTTLGSCPAQGSTKGSTSSGSERFARWRGIVGVALKISWAIMVFF